MLSIYLKGDETNPNKYEIKENKIMVQEPIEKEILRSSFCWRLYLRNRHKTFL